MKRAFRLLILGLIAAAPLWSAHAADFFIHDSDRVVFLGDSITEQRLYTTYIEAYVLTRHPDWKLWFRNVGWGGDTSWLRQRSHPNEGELFAADAAKQQQMVEASVDHGLARDVLSLKPTAVTVNFGMNDHYYQAFREDIFRAYVRSQAEIAKVLQANGVRVAFLTPQPIEDNRPDPDKDVRNESLRKFADGLKQVAEKAGARFVDEFDPYMSNMMRERASNPAAHIGGGDAVHPGPAGHTIMAWAILKGLGASPLVSAVTIDSVARKISAAEGCRVTNLKVAADSLSFDRLDRALPMPIDSRAEAALKLAPILKDLDQYELRVEGLPAGQYELSIDGQATVKYSASDLAKGCNLAVKAGPVTDQAREVLRLVFAKNDLFFQRWRNVQLYNFPAWAKGPDLENKRQAELKRLDLKIAGLEKEIDAARQPKLRHFELKPATS